MRVDLGTPDRVLDYSNFKIIYLHLYIKDIFNTSADSKRVTNILENRAKVHKACNN
jgi:hypothetical protein